MSFDLDKIQEMWEKDAKIDMDNLHIESTNIPSLHAKYFEIYNTIFLLRKKAEQQRKNIRHERYEYFSGKADPDIYIDNPFPKKIRDKDTMQKYLDADEKLSGVCLKIDYYDTMLVYVESILKQISNRTYQIKNSIEFMRFNSGVRMMNEDFREEEFYTIETPIQGVRIIHKALSIALDKTWWRSRRTAEPLFDMKDNFFRILLDHQFNRTDIDRPDDN